MSEDQEFSGVNVEDAAGPVEAVVNDHQEADGNTEERNVPLDALQAERSERQRLQDELKLIKENMSLMMAQQSRTQAPQKEEFDGLADDDVLTVGEFKKALQHKEKQYQRTLTEVKMTQKYPDYESVVTKYLPEVLKSNPGLANTLQSSQDYELAYYLAKNSDSYRKEHQRTKRNQDAERIVENASRAGSLSSVGHNSAINNAKRYKNMSDEEFMSEVNRNLGYF